MQKCKIVSLAVLIGILAIVGVAYATIYSGQYFIATEAHIGGYANTEMSKHRIDFTNHATDGDTIDMGAGDDTIQMMDGNDSIRMGTGDDQFHMAGGNDVIGLGAGSDIIRFYGGLNGASTETIGFNDPADATPPDPPIPPTTYIQYTSSNDTIEIKSNSGDVIITFGQ
jgi:hypothetical protein